MSKSTTAPSVLAAMKQVEHESWQPFIQQTHCPAEVQRTLLQTILDRQADTTFGRKHFFTRIRSYEEYRRALPIHSYEDLRSYIEEQDRCREPVLTVEQPTQFVQTSGTTGQPKYIPICPSTRTCISTYQRLFTFAQYQGVANIFEGHILVLSGQSVEGYLPTGTAYGSMSGLLYDALPSPIRHKDLLSSGVRALNDIKAKYWHIVASALAEPSLSVVATPNPSTLLKLMELIRQHYAELVEALSCRGSKADISVPPVTSHRLAHLKTYVGRESDLTFSALWPDLRAVITWMGGNCGALIPKLKPVLPETTALVEMGYLSSECLGSLNVDVINNRCVPTFHDNLFEFVPLAEWETADPKTFLLDQVEIGEKYQLLVTTPSGLYRYAMNDIVEVTGRFNGTPTIRFVQKGKGVTNITGEKLYEHHVTTAVDAVLARLSADSEFYVMVADVDTQQYTLYVEHANLPATVAEEVDRTMAEVNVEFLAKRESGRLRPVVVRSLRPGTGEAYRTHCINKGQRESQFKLVRLQYRHECSFEFSQHLQ